MSQYLGDVRALNRDGAAALGAAAANGERDRGAATEDESEDHGGMAHALGRRSVRTSGILAVQTDTATAQIGTKSCRTNAPRVDLC